MESSKNPDSEHGQEGAGEQTTAAGTIMIL